ncbi:activating signal cointegrator 1 complex subunit 2 isoform X2 [Lasioglossum baleicum]|uniref:activating signal cointegrator 1 complex subunit 2 isoform X2 n=1 Tax=Lasioglossum baleicum TaxID=434251 RepID=UPI003FCE9864
MTENASHDIMEPFENPECLPLEQLKLKIKSDGVVEYDDALSNRWADDRYFLHYEAPDIYNEDGSEIIGAKERWVKIVEFMINDLKWLLSLPFFRFWSNVVYNKSILDALVSVLQEAPPFYALENFPNCPLMQGLLETIRYYVLVFFTRLITNKESPEEYINHGYLGNLLYEKYMFTVPIIFDLCQLYGRENGKVMKKILQCLFELEPQYNNDLKKAVPCLIEALENVERKFDHSIGHNSNEAVSLSQKNTGYKNLTLFNLEDLILYVLDISSTITVFLNNYSPAVSLFHREDFVKKIVSIYENTIPEMYKTLHQFGHDDENMLKLPELNHRLDVTRVEIINLFRIILFDPIESIQKERNTISEADIKEHVEEYFKFLMFAIPEKEFITDYNQFYSVEEDLVILASIYDELDMIHCSYILNLIQSCTREHNTPSTSSFNHISEAVAGPSGVQSQPSSQSEPVTKPSTSNNTETLPKVSVHMPSLVSAVKEILDDLEDRFVEVCLEHYGYDTEAVINAILEDTLPPKLNDLKELGPIINDIPDRYTTTVNEAIVPSIEALGLFNADEDEDEKERQKLYVRKPEEIAVPKDYIKRNYSLVAEDCDYDDEYDDTYDHRDVRGTENDRELESRPFTTPRILLGKQKSETVDESESEDDEKGAEQNGKDHFIQNPADLRAKAEQRRQAMRGGRGASNVTGKPKGHGQEKDVLHNRQQKNTHKSTRANHNRRSGAQWKRTQGMVPS